MEDMDSAVHYRDNACACDIDQNVHLALFSEEVYTFFIVV
jgi:hypothetical protein